MKIICIDIEKRIKSAVFIDYEYYAELIIDLNDVQKPNNWHDRTVFLNQFNYGQFDDQAPPQIRGKMGQASFTYSASGSQTYDAYDDRVPTELGRQCAVVNFVDDLHTPWANDGRATVALLAENMADIDLTKGRHYSYLDGNRTQYKAIWPKNHMDDNKLSIVCELKKQRETVDVIEDLYHGKLQKFNVESC